MPSIIVSFFCTPDRFAAERGRAYVDRAGVVPLPVDLNRLSPTARRLAELVRTTDRRDDGSQVVVEVDYDPMPDLRAYVRRVYQGPPEALEAAVQAYARVYDVEPGAKPLQWTWKPAHVLCADEPPERWFEREAIPLDAVHARIIRAGMARVEVHHA